MLTQSINAWLSDPGNYGTGLDLLRQTGKSGFSLTVLAMGDDAYNRNRLETELRTWLAKQNNLLPIADPAAEFSKSNSATESSTGKNVLTKKQTFSPDTTPEMSENPSSDGLQSLHSRRGQLLDERADLKSRIRAVADADRQADRRDWAYRIKAITRDLDEVYSQLNFFDEYGYLPPPPSAPDVDDQTLLLNVRTYVSRYRGKVKKAKTPADRQAAQTLLDQYEAEKKRLETKLTRPTDAV